MKKKYITPSMLEFRIEAQPILSGSKLDPYSDTPTVAPDSNEQISGGFGSRGFDGDWDDEDW